MTYIKSIHLKNFQRHSDLVVDFVNGVNIIHGESDKGKSSIRRAIEWVCFNHNIDGIRKTRTKQTTVTITLDNDTEIERVRSASINRYIIREKGEEKTFDSIGRSIPDEVKEVLSILPIEFDGEEIYLNSHNQIALPFLMDKSPSTRMKLFNKLTGNDVLDKLFSELNKDILRIKKAKKSNQDEIGENEKIIAKKNIETEQNYAIYSKLKQRLKSVKEKEEKLQKLLKLNGLYKELISKLEVNNSKLKDSKKFQDIDIKPVTLKIERFEKAKSLQNALERAKIGLNKVEGQLKRKDTIDPLKIKEIQGKIDRLHTLKSACIKMKDIQQTLTIHAKQMQDVSISLRDNIREYKKLLRFLDTCPTCGGKITEECLKEINL